VELLELVAARLAIGEQASEELPGLATEALVRGLDSPSLRKAAGLSPRDVRDARDAFVDALGELGVLLPDEQPALWLLIRDTLRRIVDGSITAYEGASWIWHRAFWRVEREGDLRVFVGLASECDDHPGSRPAIERAIRDAAVELLARGELRSWLKLQARVGGIQPEPDWGISDQTVDPHIYRLSVDRVVGQHPSHRCHD
jgi:hypothetical protein